MPSFSEFHTQLADLESECFARLCCLLKQKYGAIPVMALEYEFYLSLPESDGFLQTTLHMINNTLADAGIEALPAEEERGAEQYEISLPPSADLIGLAARGRALVDVIKQAAKQRGGNADFRSKPYGNDFGNGLHIHLHFENESGEYLYFRDESGHHSPALLWSVEGMLQLLPESMMLFAPYPESYARFAQSKQNAPTTVSWGPNNRTVAVRMPNKPANQKHLEHRVSAPDADPGLAMIAIVAAALYGLQIQEYPPEAIHGDASDTQYDCDSLPNFEDALQLFQGSERLPKLIGNKLYSEILRRLLMPESF